MLWPGLIGRQSTLSRLAVRAGRRNPHGPAHAGRRRQPRWQRLRRSHWRRGIGSLIDALTLIGLVRSHVPIRVADIHVPSHRVIHVILGQVQQGIPWAPAIWPVAHTVDHRGRRAIINRLGGTSTQTGQTAGHQHSRSEPDEYSLHGFPSPLGGCVRRGSTRKAANMTMMNP